jgi:hypothetical protein
MPLPFKPSGFGRMLERLMATSPEGPMRIQNLAHRTGLPRSTIYRHLSGAHPGPGALQAYARAFGIAYTELADMAGYADPEDSLRDPEIRALAVQIGKLDRSFLPVIWGVVSNLQLVKVARSEGEGP